MFLTPEQRHARLLVRLVELPFWSMRATANLEHWSFNGEPLNPGDAWPTRHGVNKLSHPEMSVPSAWPLEHARLLLDLGGEGLVHIRYGGGREEGFGLDPNHQRFPLLGSTFSIEADMVARFPFGVPNRSPHIWMARLVLLEPSLMRLIRQLKLIAEAVGALHEHEVVYPLLDCAEAALASITWPSSTGTYLARTAESPNMLSIWELPERLDPQPEGLNDEERASVARAVDRLETDLRNIQLRYPPQGKLAVTGQAHLDLAWLWPLKETRRKAQRTYHTAISLMDRYPEFRFHQSTAQIYAFIEEDDPDLFARIREKSRAGQWETIGGMWVEPDLNMPTGESLVRQLLYGQRYFDRTFGSTHTVAWLPDCFGFTPALPQLLRSAGIENFFTTKLNWSETNRFPYDLFLWEGLDGSRVLAYMFDNPEGRGERLGLSGYNGDPGPYAAVNTWRNDRAKYVYPEGLLSIGYGDGGGGPTAEMIEDLNVLATFPAIPNMQFTVVREFYDRLRAGCEGKEVPVWVGELYLELHRGTLTSQGRTKYLHRRAERDLVAAEVLSAMNVLLGGAEPASLESHWRMVLRNEFHDILPGSSIREVYETAEAELSTVIQKADVVIQMEGRKLVEHLSPAGSREGLLVVNPDLSPRPLRIEVNHDVPSGQQVEGGYVLSSGQVVPALGAHVVFGALSGESLDVSLRHLENDLIRVDLAEDGTLSSVYDKRAGREVLDGRGNALWVYVDKPRDWDAWDIDIGYTQAGEEIRAVESIDVVESGPHRAAIRITRRFRNSRITQDIRLWANSARLEFKTTLDWRDRHWLLKTRFPLAVRSPHATFEVAFGVIQRPTHRNTSWETARFEVAGHRFADLSEPGYGVALLNDGKYGHHVLGNELGLSLLRSPAYPDPLADEGIQTFTYALYPHEGTWCEGGVLMEAEDLNRPLLAWPCNAESETSWQALKLEGLPLGLGTLKVLEDGGGLVLRAYEPQGARGPVALNLPSPWLVESEMNLLERFMGSPALSFTPFQVHSWLLRRR